jgi:uncharacterized protein (DUF433 family)
MPGVYCIAVSDVLKHVASGISQENVLRDFPDLRTEHIRAILIYVAEREKKLSELTIV